MEKKWTRNAPISEIDDKRSITATYSITMENKFLPMQLIYKGKTSQSLPKIHFPNGFSLSANLKHYSNETESLKFLKDIILSYVKTERERLGLETQPALLIYDVFWRQTTDKFLDVLKDNILSTKIPPNMTHVFQTLDLTVNKFAKDFMKGMFSTWFSRQLSLGLENGVELDDIEVDYRLSFLKPLHAKWLVELYNHMSTDEGKEIAANGWHQKSRHLLNLVQAVFHLWIHLQIYALWSNFSSYVKAWVYRPFFQKSLTVFARKSRKVRMTRNGKMKVILIIAQNQNQMMMETRLMHSIMTGD